MFISDSDILLLTLSYIKECCYIDIIVCNRRIGNYGVTVLIKVWSDAAAHIVFALSPAWGILITQLLDWPSSIYLMLRPGFTHLIIVVYFVFCSLKQSRGSSCYTLGVSVRT